MFSRRLIAALALLCALSAHAQAQPFTKSQLNAQIGVNFPDNTTFLITPQNERTIADNIVNSIMPTSPVVSGNIACWNGTTGLLQDCTSAPTPNAITALTGDGTATGPGSVPLTLATVNSNVGPFGSATLCPTITVNGKGLTTAASATTCAPAVGSVTGMGTGVPAFLVTPTSANLAAALTDETGTGFAVFATSPTLTTPNIGAATATTVNKVTITPPATAATLTLATGTTLSETTSTSIGQGQYLGEASTGSATAGNIGEYIESVIPSGSAVALTSGSPKTITSISLTAGDWDVTGTAIFLFPASTSITFMATSYSATTNVFDTTPGKFSEMYMAAVVPGAASVMAQNVQTYRLSLSATTSVFLVTQTTFTASTLSAYGMVRARRAR